MSALRKTVSIFLTGAMIAGFCLILTGCTKETNVNTVATRAPVTAYVEPTKPNATTLQPTPMPTEPEDTDGDFDTYTGDFYIEGKWKSVGDYGFGQAQPGSIVAFDGTNCNFFSPQDTYAFYKDGDKYVLDTTSFLTSENVSFTVTIIDEDNIEISRASNTTVLKRVG